MIMKNLFKKFKKGIPIYLLTFAALLFAASSFAANYNSSQNGPWNDSNTWGGAGIPGAGDDVTITHDVTHTGGAFAVASLEVDGGSLVGLTLDLTLTGGGFNVLNSGYMNVQNLIVPGNWAVHWIDELSTLIVENDFTYGEVPEATPSAIWLDGLLVVKGTFTITGNCVSLFWKNVLIAGWGSDGQIYAGAYAGCGWIWGNQASLSSGNLWAWSGEIDDDWEKPGNWRYAGGTAPGIPTAGDDITINPTFPDGLVPTPVVNWPNYKNTTLNHATGDCKNLTISAGCQMTVSGEMDIFGDLLLAANQTDGTASFLASGYATVATGGSIVAEVYIPLRGNGWAIIAPPIASSLNQFISDNGISQSTKLGQYTYDIGLFDEPLSRWTWYTGVGGDHIMTPGRGLMVEVPAGQVFTFTGTQLPSFGLGSGEPVGTSAYGYNGLGNPFAAAMDMDAYLAANTGWGEGVSPTAWYYDGNTYVAYDVYGADENAQYGQESFSI